MPYLSFVFVVCFSCLFTSISAQLTLQGEVTDSIRGDKLEFVSVVAEQEGGKILAYAYTEPTGRYRLSLPHSDLDSIYITASLMGYEVQKKVVFPPFTSPINFQLTTSTFELAEAVVEGDALPIRAKGDTTVYHLASFVDSTENTVEDVLRKLPGIEVDENGGIKAKGKPIKEVLVEGDNMFGLNYSFGTRNVKADAISSVEVIDNYDDDVVLRQVRKTGDVVINLKISENKKRQIAGSFEVGAGWQNARWYADFNLFSFSKKNKLVAFGNTHNTGENRMGGNILNDNTVAPFAPYYVSDFPFIKSDPIPQQAAIQQENAFAQVSNIYNITPQFKVKLDGFSNSYQQQQKESFSFRLINEDYRYEENRAKKFNRFQNDMKIEGNWVSKQEKQHLRFISHLSSDYKKSYLPYLRTIHNEAADTTTSFMNSTGYQVEHYLNYSNAINSNSAMKWSVAQNFQITPQQLTFRYDAYPSLFNIPDSLVYLQQGHHSRTHKGMISGEYFFRMKGLETQTSAGYYIHQQNLDTNISHAGTSSHTDASYSKKLNNQLDIKAPFINTSITTILQDKYRIITLLDAEYKHLRFKNINRKSIEFLAHVRGEFPMSFKDNFFAFYKFSRALPNIRFFHQLPLLRGYQNIQASITDIEPKHTHAVGINYHHNNTLTLFNASSGLSYSMASSFPIKALSTLYHPRFLYYDFYTARKSQQFNARFSIDKFLSSIRSKFKLRFSFTKTIAPTRVNNETRKISSDNYLIKLNYGSAFDGWVNILLQSQYTWNRSKANLSSSIYRSWHNKATLVIRHSESKHWHFKIIGHHVSSNTSLSNTTQQIHFLEAEGSYKLKTKNVNHDLSLSIFNILNTKVFSSYFLDEYVERKSSIQATPLFFILKWGTNF